MKFILSVAHHEKAKGATSDHLNEYDISRVLTKKIGSVLQKGGIDVDIISNASLSSKVRQVNALVEESMEDCVCVEFHFNSAGQRGSLVLYYTEGYVDGHESKQDTYEYQLSRDLLSVLTELNRGVYAESTWEGTVPLPSSFRNSKISMLHDINATGFIVELDSIDQGQWFIDNQDHVANICAKALLKVKTEIEG